MWRGSAHAHSHGVPGTCIPTQQFWFKIYDVKSRCVCVSIDPKETFMDINWLLGVSTRLLSSHQNSRRPNETELHVNISCTWPAYDLLQALQSSRPSGGVAGDSENRQHTRPVGRGRLGGEVQQSSTWKVGRGRLGGRSPAEPLHPLLTPGSSFLWGDLYSTAEPMDPPNPPEIPFLFPLEFQIRTPWNPP